ncbi:MAG: cytochrome b5-like heme/steroid binding domain-containing protein [Rhodocyclaceae bacterium]
MKRLVTWASVAFWAIVALALARAPHQSEEPSAATATVHASTQAPPLTRAETARHDRADDCWMIIEGQIYDFSAYLPQHPAPPQAMLKYCGKDATEGFLTKDHARPHSNYARNLMAHYLLGPLQP